MHVPLARALTIVAFLAAPAAAQSTIRITSGLNGAEPDGASRAPRIGGDGRFVVFESDANNLTADPQSPSPDVFLHDAVTGTVELVSVRLPLASPPSSIFGAVVSDDGRWVAFSSDATDLLPGDDTLADVYLRDRASGTTTRVTGAQGGLNTAPSISPDGAWIAFTSTGDGVVPGGAHADIFRFDRAAGTFALVSQSTGGHTGNAPSSEPWISADGAVVAFVSRATNLVAGDTNTYEDVFARDLAAGTTRRVSLSLSGAQLARSSAIAGLSRDGARVGFVNDGIDVIPGDNDWYTDVFVRHVELAHMLWASRPAAGNGGLGSSNRATIAGAGRHVLFWSLASDLVVPDTTSFAPDLYCKDLETGAIEVVSLTRAGVAAVGTFFSHAISDDGRFVAFECASALVPGDLDGHAEIYVRDRGPVVYTTPCAGDGWSRPCPCGNPGDLGNGCENYALARGVRLSATGAPSVAHDTLRLDLAGFLAQPTPIAFVQGDALSNGGIGAPFGDGVQCVGGNTVRFGRRIASGGTSSYGAGVTGDAPLSVAGQIVAPGSTRYYQCVYFNFGSFCGQLRRNWSNSIQLVWNP